MGEAFIVRRGAPSMTTGNITDFKGLPYNTTPRHIRLSWTDPDDVYWQSTKIMRKISGYPVDENDGTFIINSMVRNQYAGSNYYEDTDVLYGTSYFYQAFPIAQNGRVNRSAINRAYVLIQ